MRIPLNKAIRSAQAEPVGDISGTGFVGESFTDGMNHVLKSVSEQIEKIDTSDKRNRREYIESLKKLEAEKDRVTAQRDNAESEEEYDKADNEIKRITDKMNFFERQIYKIDHTARLSETEYNNAVTDIDNMIREAAAHCSHETKKIYEQLSAIKTAYLKLLADADKVLIKLDNTSNFLQSRYTHRITQYQTEEVGVYNEVATFDPNEWTRHTRRYNNGRGYDYLDMTPGESRVWHDVNDRKD